MIYQGNSIDIMPMLKEQTYNTCVTSPPYYGLRNYGLPETEWPEVTYYPMAGMPPITIARWSGCLGLEPTPEMFIGHLVFVFRQVWRLLRKDGTLWLNLGDSFFPHGGHQENKNPSGDKLRGRTNKYQPAHKFSTENKQIKPKDLMGIPWRAAFALQADGWYLRMDNIWQKPNPLPESVKDRPTKSHEYIFLFSKQRKYYFDHVSIMENLAPASLLRLSQNVATQKGSIRANAGHKTNGPMKALSGYGENEDIPLDQRKRNKRSVWTVATAKSKGNHFATFPIDLVKPCILAGSPEGGYVLDPFGGTGTTMKVALQLNRHCTIIELNPSYVTFSEKYQSATLLE